MKKTIKSLLAIAIGAFAFTACSDVPMPEGYNPKQGTGLVDYVPEGSGTATDPYNVAGVIEGTKDLPKGQSTTTDLYTKGYVAEVGEFNASYGNITFYITDSPEGKSKKFYVYRCLGLGGEKFAAADDLKVGDVVTVCGKVKNYNGTFEYDQGSYLVKLNDKSSGGGGGGGEAAEPQGDGSQGNPFNVAGAVVKCQETGETATADAYYIKGKVKTVTEEFNTNYGNGTFTMVDEGFTQTFTAYRVLYLGNKKYTSADTQIKEGDEVIVYGKIVNFKGNTPETSTGAYLYSLNGNTGGGGGEATYGPEAGSGTEAAPYNVAAAVAKCVATGETATTESFYIKGKANADYTVGSYKNVELDIVDDGYTGTFKVFRVKDKESKGIKEGYKINKGDVIVVYGPVVNYKGNTPETATGAYLVSVNGQAPELDDGQGGGGEGGGGGTATELVNGNFEAWDSASQPTGWKSACTASSATLAQSSDAHAGSYSCNVNGNESQNKRLATQEITLAAGTYVFAAWIKATTEDVAQARLGYTPVTDGSAGSYSYDSNYCNLSTSWQQFSYEFTLAAETTVCLVVMNPKKSSYSSGKDILIDDATLTKK